MDWTSKESFLGMLQSNCYKYETNGGDGGSLKTANGKSRVASKGIPVRLILNQQKFYKSGENRMHFRVPEEKKHCGLLYPQSKTRTLIVPRPALWEMLKGGLVLEVQGWKHTEVQHASRAHV